MAAPTPLRTALRDEIARALGTIAAGSTYHTTPNIHAGYRSLEDLGRNGLPAVCFDVIDETQTDAATGLVSIDFEVGFVLFAQSTAATASAVEAVENLTHDVERCLKKNWIERTTGAAIATTGATFIRWYGFDKNNPVAALSDTGTAYTRDIMARCVIHRDQAQP